VGQTLGLSVIKRPRENEGRWPEKCPLELKQGQGLYRIPCGQKSKI